MLQAEGAIAKDPACDSAELLDCSHPQKSTQSTESASTESASTESASIEPESASVIALASCSLQSAGLHEWSQPRSRFHRTRFRANLGDEK